MKKPSFKGAVGTTLGLAGTGLGLSALLKPQHDGTIEQITESAKEVAILKAKVEELEEKYEEAIEENAELKNELEEEKAERERQMEKMWEELKKIIKKEKELALRAAQDFSILRVQIVGLEKDNKVTEGKLMNLIKSQDKLVEEFIRLVKQSVEDIKKIDITVKSLESKYEKVTKEEHEKIKKEMQAWVAQKMSALCNYQNLANILAERQTVLKGNLGAILDGQVKLTEGLDELKKVQHDIGEMLKQKNQNLEIVIDMTSEMQAKLSNVENRQDEQDMVIHELEKGQADLAAEVAFNEESILILGDEGESYKAAIANQDKTQKEMQRTLDDHRALIDFNFDANIALEEKIK